MRITGKVTYVKLSGGFWGIEGDDGQKYHPVDGLPKAYQKEGQRVSAKVSPVQAFGIFMWGQDVNVEKIDQL
ncbi:MAG: hypothetical protein AAF901_12095 [Bacteroidota bacterium]